MPLAASSRHAPTIGATDPSENRIPPVFHSAPVGKASLIALHKVVGLRHDSPLGVFPQPALRRRKLYNINKLFVINELCIYNGRLYVRHMRPHHSASAPKVAHCRTQFTDERVENTMLYFCHIPMICYFLSSALPPAAVPPLNAHSPFYCPSFLLHSMRGYGSGCRKCLCSGVL